jgi:hypothetical protein
MIMCRRGATGFLFIVTAICVIWRAVPVNDTPRTTRTGSFHSATFPENDAEDDTDDDPMERSFSSLLHRAHTDE